ncbi:putative Phospho-2-dehydro-3-deoxyheptonate aldolase 2, chloroplastic [Cocos nucifera]|nr:putative Phospho-2-dehydro-3-deoxyheptonate aldolase 2, chloroplastic [Cocos nucifera]
MAALFVGGNATASLLPTATTTLNNRSAASSGKTAGLARNSISSSLSLRGEARSSSSSSSNWAKDSWKSKKALQIPTYPNQEELNTVLRNLETYPPLVFAGEARKLEERVAAAAVGRAFLLQGGDCAESFKEFNANNIRDTFRVLLQMGVVLTFGGQMPIIKNFIKKNGTFKVSDYTFAYNVNM